ncbi:MAG: filamentous hemagglutinin N-terminal domain-containing protein [Desulfamplus sp.]|nr:filamentous hemagglutinin N-terminal domain-containing protein [Desulfamplus sp.]
MLPKQLVKHLSLYLIATLFCIFSLSPALLYADISTDGTVGAAQTLTGPDYTIPETLGTIKGDNLFHSFDKFSIKTQESATFTGSDSIKNIISRVTGGEKSEIDGTLRSNVGKADFYFINPNGVVFGENAKVDVPAAFHVSTADELKFQDGSSFKASKSKQSTLTQASPESFGFLDTPSASIEVNGAVFENRGSIEINASNLEFKPESKVSLTSSKDITMKGTEKETTTGAETKQASLTSEGGEIELKAVGDLVLDNARVESSGNGGGRVSLKAGCVKLQNNAKIAADNKGDKTVDGNGVEIKADKTVEIKQGSRVQSNVFSSGDSGTVTVEAQNMLIQQQNGETLTGLFIEVQPEAKGNGESINVKVKDKLTIQGLGEILSLTHAQGDAASINVSTGDFLMDGEKKGAYYLNENGLWSASVSSITTKPDSDGKAGEITVNATGRIDLIHGAGIASMTFSKGDAGNVSVKSSYMKIDGSIEADEQDDLLTGIVSLTNSEGNASKIEIVVDELFEMNNGGIEADTWLSKGDAGEIIIKAGSIILDNKSLIASGAFGGISFGNEIPDAEGYVGSIKIDADFITMLNHSDISISAAGSVSEEKLAYMPEKKSINLTTKQLYLDNVSRITAESFDDNVPAGNINIEADKIIVENTSQIRTSSNNTDGGNITINTNNISLLDSIITTSVIGEEGEEEKAIGNGGNIEITSIKHGLPAGFLIMQNGFIQANTLAKGAKGGSIRINPDTLLIADKSMPFQIGGEPEKFSLDDKKNIIQAAAPSKNPQDIETPTVPVDLGSSLINSGSTIFEPVKMAENYCRLIGTKRASSLILETREWFVPAASANSSIYFDGYRLDELLKYEGGK